MKAKWFFRLLSLSVLAVYMGGCSQLERFLPPQKCHPSQDLPVTKALKPLPEVDTSNTKFYTLFAGELAAHAVDVRDYNSLYSQCVGAPDVK